MVTDHQTYRQRTVTFDQGVTWAWPFLPVGVEQEQGVGPWKAPLSDHNYFLLSKIETDLENVKYIFIVIHLNYYGNLLGAKLIHCMN